jgi:flagellar basal-body rod protein FlgG
MFRASQIAATGMMAQQLNVEVISNNISNLNTTSYKRRIAGFQDLLYQTLNTDIGTQTTVGGNISPVGTSIGLGVTTSGIFSNLAQGSLQQTDNNLDIAIQGRGYFRVLDAQGVEYYTRDGRFSTNEQGIIVNPEGYELDPNITIPQNASEVTINQDGEVIVTVDEQPAPQLIGRITLVNFINEGGLRPVGNNLYVETFSSGAPLDSNPGEISYGTLQQGFVEASNVDAVLEITELIRAQRAYELNSRVISSADEMLSAVNQIR